MRFDAVASFLARDGLQPGCYDSPEFLEIEQRLGDPRILEDYAASVLTRPQTPGEARRVRDVVEVVTKKLVEEAPYRDLLGGCQRMSLALVRMLERAGVWCFAVKGSARFDFDPRLGITPTFFYTRDVIDFPGGCAGHAWVVAPPFVVIDCTTRTQLWQHGEEAHVPSRVLVESATIVEPALDLHTAPPLRAEYIAPQAIAGLREFWAWMRTVRVAVGPVRITYQPGGIILPPPTEPLEALPLKIGGRQAAAFFDEAIAPSLRVPAGAA